MTRIIGTNWINIVGIFLITYLYSFIRVIIETDFSIIQAMLSALILVGLYGLLFWIGFLLLLIILDTILVVRAKEKLKTALFIEWVIISIPLIYWMIKYEQWIFLIAVITFFITQIIRERKIRSLLK